PEEPEYVIPFPEPPQPRKVQIPKEPVPQFVDPLNIVLKGIIVVHNDDSKNRALITDTRTKKEEIYKVGDVFEDAQLIKIFNKKVVFLRSNGQQEVLYLRSKDAELDPAYVPYSNWKDMVRQINDEEYLVSPHEFSAHITTLAQFIDLFDLTTVYSQGESIGCRVGRIEDGSLAEALGFKPNDLILMVDGIPATDSKNRFKIYKTIVAMKTKESIVVELERENNAMTLTYTLEDFKPESLVKKATTETTTKQAITKSPTIEQINRLEERHKLAPTVRDFREKEKQNMLKKGRNSLTSKFAE
ncbi:MAG TPA: hypothetical protein VFF04_00605, partial [Candidatus Babeliales bacterium]|nr:hypothetical protein [Candidatus Babeliales bacterium]